jgi:ABC-2 type transport system permease protein
MTTTSEPVIAEPAVVASAPPAAAPATVLTTAGQDGGRPMALRQFEALTMRLLRSLVRRPAFVAITLVQAIVWLPLFGSLFKSVATVPGFGSGDYLDYLTPGVATMSVLFSAGWTGIRFIDDMESGVMERLLASPTRRWAIVGGTVAHEAVIVAVQVTLVVLLGWGLGAHLRSGVPGVLVLLVVAVTLSTAIAALSDALALVVRRREALIAAANFLVLPLTFLSTGMMPERLLPGWIRTVSRFNPANWAVTASRSALAAQPDWSMILRNLGLVVALAVVSWALATRAFRGYQRSL